MLTPKLQGRILQSLGIGAADRLLEIGTGTGYLAACMSLLGAETVSLDIRPEFTGLAAANLPRVAGARVRLVTQDALGAEPLGEYDAIAVTGSMPVYDARFERALKPGGRMFAVVGSAPVMDAILVRRVDIDEWVRESLFETVIEPLVNARAAPGFVF
jgi:protein-L-isoaspartate(D-aspartate) O-methyltransferase